MEVFVPGYQAKYGKSGVAEERIDHGVSDVFHFATLVLEDSDRLVGFLAKVE